MKILLLSLFCFQLFAGNVPMDVVQFDAETTDATQTVLYSETIPDLETWTIRINCEAVKNDRAKRSSFEKLVTIFREGASLSIPIGSNR